MASEKQYYDDHLINFSSSTGYPTIWTGVKNELLHRYIWEKYNGKIPKGYEVHHKDKNRINYDINNLELIETELHHRLHALQNGLGKSNKGKPKLYASGCCKGATPVELYKMDETIRFESIASASKFLSVGTGSVSRVLSGKRKTVRGWKCRYAREKF